MKKFEINIPETFFQKDFTIIYKGREEREGEIIEPIEEIKTSKEQFLLKLRYFKNKSNEIKQTNEIFIHDKYSPQIFSDFIGSLQTNKIEIDEKNYKDISELSHKYEFHELTQEIDQFSRDRPDVKDIINDQIRGEIDPIKEEKLAQNLDICLKNDNFANFPIPVLVRILNSPKRILNDHHLLFNFIDKIITKNNNDNDDDENVEILVSCLDYMQMSNDELDSLFNNEKFKSIFGLKHSKERMKSFHEQNKMNENRIAQLEGKFSELFNKFESQTHIIEQKYQDLNEKFVEQEQNLLKYRKENEDLQKSLKNQEEIMKTVNQLSQDQNEMKNKLCEQEQNLLKYQKENEDLQKSIKNQEELLKQYKESFKPTGTISATVDSNQIIKGQIKIKDKMNVLDRTRSKYILNTNNSPKISEMGYENGIKIQKLDEEINFIKAAGTYFIHALIVDTQGSMNEIISKPITTRGAYFSFNYTGRVQSVILCAGKYKIEVWGAEGGENEGQIHDGKYTGTAGKGGYSVGTLSLTKETKLFVHVGGSSKSSSGGWNGGGSAKHPAAGGGGSSDVSLFGEEGSTNWSNNDHLYSRIIVAGGGGGSGHTNYSDWGKGSGGGLNGEGCGNGKSSGGTQTGGYAFGIGESYNFADDSGGGGGWYGGNAYCNKNGNWGRGGGGGSGFVYNSTTASNYPSGCKLNTSFYLTDSSTISGKNEFPNINGNGTEKGHQGNGFAKITPL